MFNDGMKDKVLDKILEMLMGLKGSEEMAEPEMEAEPKAAVLEIEAEALPKKAQN